MAMQSYALRATLFILSAIYTGCGRQARAVKTGAQTFDRVVPEKLSTFCGGRCLMACGSQAVIAAVSVIFVTETYLYYTST